mmetsp:Transcript_106908/g.147951  ORF Transcript_106908/g.147951 Transcript_106908/m.147951 type:complete len:95 (-) Transcript_106908:168-452(-)
MLEAERLQANTNKRGMGRVVSYAQLTIAKFEFCRQLAQFCGGEYKSEYDYQKNQVSKILDDAVNENNRIYFEEEVPLDIFEKPEMENFVQLQSH